MRTIYSDILKLGHAYHRQGDRPFGIRLPDRLHHLYIIGQTGTGKSTLLGNMIGQEIKAGHGFCLIDPHGDLAETVAEHLPEEDIYWDVSDPLSPHGYNPLTRTGRALRPLVASGLIDALKKQWPEAWGVRMEHLLRYAILALLEQPRADLRDIVRLFMDRAFRDQILQRVGDQQVRHFWEEEFTAMNYKTAGDGVAPIANKLGAFLSHPVVRSAITEPKAPLRFRKAMDDGTALIVNLAKGRVGTDIANVLGGLLVASLFNAALSRHDQLENQRRPFFLYVDEFQSFTTLAFASMLSEIRKYGLGVVLAHQYTEQSGPQIHHAILGNVGSMIAFRLGTLDAPHLSRFFESIEPIDLINLANYEAFVRLLVDGHRTRTFSMRSAQPNLPVYQVSSPS